MHILKKKMDFLERRVCRGGDLCVLFNARNFCNTEFIAAEICACFSMQGIFVPRSLSRWRFVRAVQRKKFLYRGVCRGRDLCVLFNAGIFCNAEFVAVEVCACCSTQGFFATRSLSRQRFVRAVQRRDFL